uniref:Retrotransposon gag domain-containing protein n=1 Tax=Tanacetum cinerariifolium TaxID=118510 RepID=A0A699H3R6_TANCI|nr:hypothetical protein [Tanacetum cinerariifolium]
MRTCSSSNLPVVSHNPSTSNPKRRNRRRSKQPFILEESPIDTMADQRTMAELRRAPTEGYAEAIVEDLVSKFINEFFPPSRTTNLRNKISNFQQWFNESFHEAWDRYKDLLRACPHHSFTELQKLDTFYNALNPADQDSLNAAAGGNLLERRSQDVLKIIENKSKVRNSQNKSVVSQVKSCDANSNSSLEIAKLTHAVNQQTSDVTTAMTAILKQFQATPPPAFVKAVEEICVTCGGAHPYYKCLAAGFAQPNVQNNQNRFGQPQGFNRGNNFNPKQSYQAPTQQNQNVPLNELEKVKRTNEANMKAMQTQINILKNKLRNEMKNSIQGSLSNQTNEIKNMIASLFQMNSASNSGSGSLPSNVVANPKGKLKAITTQSGRVLDGPTIPTPPSFIHPEEDERVEETLTDSDLAEYTIKVPPPPQEKDEVQIYKFWQMFKQLHVNITLANALILMPKYQKMLKALLSNKEKLQELENTPLNENCSAVILNKLLEKLGDPGKFLIPCGFSELKCKALTDLGASINLMPLSVWKKLGLPELISTRMTLELANRAICTPAGIARDVFVSVGKFTFLADFTIVDYESDPKVPLILERPFLRTAHALIDVYGEQTILHDGDERLTLNMRHDTSSYSNQPQKESINLINHHPLLEELADELALITFPPKYDDDLWFDIESDLKDIEFLLHQDIDSSLKDSIDQSNLANTANNFVDSMPEMFTDEHALDYSSPPIFDEYDDDFLEVESDTKNVYDDPFDSKGEKIKEPKLLIDELDFPCDFLPPSEYDSFISEDFSRVDFKTRYLTQDTHILAVPCLYFYPLNQFKYGGNKRFVGDLDYTKDLHPPLHVNPLSGSTTYSSSLLLEELVDELALITFPLKYDDDLQFDVEYDLKEIEFMLHQHIDFSLQDSIDKSNLADNFVDSMPEMFTDEHASDYSSLSIFDEYDDDFLEVESDTENIYDDPFDSKGEKIKEVDALPSTNNEDKVFNPGILIQEKPFEIITRVVHDKKLATSNASLMLEDFDPPLYELLFFKEVPRSNMLLLFLSENEEKVFKPGIHTSEKVHSSFIP